MNTIESKKRINVANIIFVLLLIVRIIMLTSMAFSRTNIIRICIYGLIGLGGSLFILSMINNIKKTDVILFILFIYLAFEYSQSKSRDVFLCIMSFVLMLTTWNGARAVKVTDKMGKFMVALEMLQGLILIYISRGSLAYKGYVDNMAVSKELTLGFSNPNQTGMILFSTIGILLMTSKKYIKNKYVRLIIYAELLYLFTLVLKTTARTSIIAVIIVLLAMVFKLETRNLKKHHKLIGLISVMQLPFCYFYMWLGNNPKYVDMEFMNKKLLSGREELYTDVLSRWDNTLYGDIGEFLFQNSHNAALTVLINIGIIGFILYTVYILVELKDIHNLCYKGTSIYPIIVIVLLFIQGYTEASVLTGGTFYYLNLLIFICIALNSTYDENKAELTEGEG